MPPARRLLDVEVREVGSIRRMRGRGYYWTAGGGLDPQGMCPTLDEAKAVSGGRAEPMGPSVAIPTCERA